MPFDSTDLSPVTEKNIAKVRAQENLARLRDFIGWLPADKFNMSTWGVRARRVDPNPHTCDTVACIGGWAEALFRVGYADWDGVDVPVLGLSRHQAGALFYPCAIDSDIYKWGRITQKQAMAAIDNVIACGWPKWREAVKAR